MYEVELKLPADVDAARDRLQELGATERGEVRQADTYYDAPHRDFAETDEAVRVRRVDDGSGTVGRLTYKGPLIEAASKTREEHETAVDPDAAGRILEALGFIPVATVEKTRESYALDGYTVALDAVDGVGEFVEVERAVPGSGPGSDPAVTEAREGARALLERVGLDPDDQIRTSYLELLLDD